MDTHKQLAIGLFGFGVVGEGIYRVLQETPSLNATIKKICIKHSGKQRNAPAALFTTESHDLLDDPEINLIVELIDNAASAFDIVSIALQNRKAVVSANKKMIAEHVTQLLVLQKKYQTPFLYEAAVCGSVPVIRNLEEYYDNDLLHGFAGIVNGSTNFILTRMKEEKETYEKALLLAQQLGFAESDPSLDVRGVDAANKLVLLLLHAYGIITHPSQLLFKGITHLKAADALVADEKGYQIKLVAQAQKLSDGKVAAFVLPQFVRPDNQLCNVRNEYNGILIESKLADKQFLYGKGAGRFPTSSAVLSDIAALRYNYKYEYRRLNSKLSTALSTDYYLNVYVSFHDWTEVNKWDFEAIEELHSTKHRQYLTGTIHLEKLLQAEWIDNTNVSIILLPEPVAEKSSMLAKSLKKISLQLAGGV